MHEKGKIKTLKYMDFLISFFKGLFDKFRIANPTAAAIVLLILSVITYGAIQGNILGVLHLEGIVQQIVSFVSLFITAAVGGGSGVAKK